MPRYSRITIRLGLACLGLGFTVGALMLANEGLAWDSRLAGLLPAHIALLMYGWLGQLIYGVAFWILPRINGQRGSVLLAVMADVLLNLGVMLVVLSTLAPIRGTSASLGAACLSASAFLFAFHAWPRLRAAAN